MFQSVELPLWLLILILLFAGVTFASHFLFPSVRWFLRRRAERVIERLNQRLTRPIEPFKLLRRQDTIQRLVYDPEVIEAVTEHARIEGVREDVAFELAKRYAREIVPSFSATTYFGFATRATKWLARAFYRVEAGPMPEATHAAIASDNAIVFVMNHRSNMDYILLIHLASDRSALSFAAGEWARVWPLGGLVRAAGAYFVRRRSRNALYRKVMARYVQMATKGGVAQAIFPEGGLSLNGGVGLPKLGLFSYVIDGFDPNSERDVLFVPVAVNYDRVLEDRVLVRAAQSGQRKFGLRWRSVVRYLFRHAFQRLTGTFLKFGYAKVSFGEPVSLRERVANGSTDIVTDIAKEVIGRVRNIVPLTPIGVLAAMLEEAEGPLQRRALIDQLAERFGALRRDHPDLARFHESDVHEAEMAVNHLLMRKILVTETEDKLRIADGNEALLAYYAESIRSHPAFDGNESPELDSVTLENGQS